MIPLLRILYAALLLAMAACESPPERIQFAAPHDYLFRVSHVTTGWNQWDIYVDKQGIIRDWWTGREHDFYIDGVDDVYSAIFSCPADQALPKYPDQPFLRVAFLTELGISPKLFDLAHSDPRVALQLLLRRIGVDQGFLAEPSDS